MVERSVQSASPTGLSPLPIASQIEPLKLIQTKDLDEIYVFYKPGAIVPFTKGYVSSFSPQIAAQEGMSLRHYFIQQGLDKQFPVDEMISFGRLDKDTSGLLLVSKKNKHPKLLDQLLLNPHYKKGVFKTSKVYRAKVKGAVDPEKLKNFQTVKIPSKNASLVDVRVENLRLLSTFQEKYNQKSSLVEVEIDEGKYHQVKKIFFALGHPVLYGGLHRVRLSVLTLARAPEFGSAQMKEGQIRELFHEEKKQLVEIYNEWLLSEKARLHLRFN